MATIKDVWPNLKPETRNWLIGNSGDTVPGDIAEEILNAQGFTVSASWFHDVHPSRIRLPSEPPPNLVKLEAYQNGLIEIQDEGSQLAAFLAGAGLLPGASKVVDFCAGDWGRFILEQRPGRTAFVCFHRWTDDFHLST